MVAHPTPVSHVDANDETKISALAVMEAMELGDMGVVYDDEADVSFEVVAGDKSKAPERVPLPTNRNTRPSAKH
jgi:hypothetical protein